MRVSIGLVGATDREQLATLAHHIEAAGFHGLWLNDGPDGDSLEGLEVAASATERLALGCGVIPIDRRGPAAIARAALRLPQHRLSIGIGSGGPADALARVATAVTELHATVDAPVLVGALGPRMRRLAAESADGALLSWLPPNTALETAAEFRRVSATGRIVLYARTIVDAAARPALDREAARYAGIPQYAANFERLGVRPIDATIDGSAEGSLSAAVEAYGAIDELVLRVITAGDDLDERIDFVERAGEHLGLTSL